MSVSRSVSNDAYVRAWFCAASFPRTPIVITPRAPSLSQTTIFDIATVCSILQLEQSAFKTREVRGMSVSFSASKTFHSPEYVCAASFSQNQINIAALHCEFIDLSIIVVSRSSQKSWKSLLCPSFAELKRIY